MNQRHPSISTQIVRHIRDCLELVGVPSAPLLDRHGIRPDNVDNRDAAVSLAAYVRFFEDAAAASRNPHFGMHAARVMSADGLGPLSFLFLSAPTLGQAFQTFAEHLNAMQEATFNAFVRDGDVAEFTYAINDEAIAVRRQDSEYSIGVMCNLMRQYAGRRFPPVEVHFEHERHGALSWYESYFDCPVFFEQPHNRLFLHASQLDRISDVLSPELFPIIAQHLKSRMQDKAAATSTVEQVRDILLARSPDSLPTLAQTAATLGVSRATLMRRLAEGRARFGSLVAERRLGYARQLLEGGERSIADIALASGYAETASFSRAFSRRFDQSPSRWRKQEMRPGLTSAPAATER